MKQAIRDIFKTEWAVSGTIIEAQTHKPLKKMKVAVLDLDDHKGDGHLSEAITDDKGRYKTRFKWDKSYDSRNFIPDIYVKVFDKEGKLLKDTRRETIRNPRRRKEINLEIDYEKHYPEIHIGGLNVRHHAFEEATPVDILNLARLMRGRRIEPNSAQLLEKMNPHFSARGLRDNNFCMTPVMKFIHHALLRKHASRHQWMELDSIFSLHYFGYSSYVYNTPNFSINYIINDVPPDSADAVDPADTTQNIMLPGTTTIVGSTTAGDGIPDYVEKVGFWCEYALTRYINPPFSLSNPASGGRIPVSIENLGGPNGLASPTQFLIHNSCSDDLIAAITCHELFHMVQYEYNAWMNPDEWVPGVMEGGAVIAEDTLFDTHNRYIVQASQSGGTMVDPQNTLCSSGGAYQMALFVKYIDEQHSTRVNAADEPMIGVEAYTNLITHCGADGYVVNSIRDSLRELPFYQDFMDFGYIDAARTDLSNSETTLGNFYLALYLKDMGVDVPDKRFDFKEDEENAAWDDIFLGANTVNTLSSVTITNDTSLPDGGSVSFSGPVNRFSAHYYIVRPVAAVSTLEVDFNATGSFTKPIVQIVQINADGTLRDIHRSDKTSYQKTIANLQDGQNLDRIVLIVCGTDTGGPFTLNVSEVLNAPDVMITQWNSPVGKEYMIDSYNWAWTWGTPDVWVDNDDNGVADSTVYFNQNNHLYIRLRNKGRAPASGVEVNFWYQDASNNLQETEWMPVCNTLGVTQSLPSISIPAGGDYTGYVNWSPAPSGASEHFCVKVVVTSPGDPNDDNKRCTNNFGHVIMYSGYIDLPIVRANYGKMAAVVERVVIPRIKENLAISELDTYLHKKLTLQSEETMMDYLRIFKSKQKIVTSKKAAFEAGAVRESTKRLRPDLCGYYSTPKSILPPGADKFDMVTVTYLVDGMAMGGYTYTIDARKAKLLPRKVVEKKAK